MILVWFVNSCITNTICELLVSSKFLNPPNFAFTLLVASAHGLVFDIIYAEK